MLKSLKTYFRFLRVKDWRAYFLIALFGFLFSKGYFFPLKEIIIFWAIVLLLLAFGFSVNDVFDTKEDQYHLEKENPLVSKEISFPKGLTFSIFLGIFGLALSTFFGLKIFLFCLIAFLLGFFYSAPPIRFKGRPFLDLISHGLFGGFLIFFFPVLIFTQKLEFFHYLLGFSFFYLSVMAELRNHLEDYETDKKGGLKTVVSVLKFEISKGLLDFLAIFSPLILFSVFLSFPLKYFFLFLILTLIFIFIFFFRKKYKSLENYRIMDIYVLFSFILILIAAL
jgi:4-hydroxybenzoate polyprenyltransferase